MANLHQPCVLKKIENVFLQSETCRHLEWLKAVQSSHGSVEMSSLMQTKIINSSGIYCVGKITQTVDFTNGLEGVLTLTVPMDERMQEPKMEFEQQESDKKEDMKMYSLNDLKTLQSKLMLIAGKTAQIQNKEKKDSMESTEEINRFVEVRSENGLKNDFNLPFLDFRRCHEALSIL